MSNIPDLNLCFCDKLCVERTWYYGKDAGRRYLNCPNGGNGCGYIRWLDEPLEERTARVVEELETQRAKERTCHQFGSNDENKIVCEDSVVEDEIESANPFAGLDESTDENKNEYEDPVEEDEEEDAEDDYED